MRRSKAIPGLSKQACAALRNERSDSNSSTAPAANSIDLFHLVNSFMEIDVAEKEDAETIACSSEPILLDPCWEDALRGLLLGDAESAHEHSPMNLIRREIHLYMGEIDDDLSPGDTRQKLVSRLRERGLDAGICRTKWEKTHRFPGGTHEYIDVNIFGIRYIVELFLLSEFQIARPSSQYVSLLTLSAPTFVGESDDLKQLVRLLCGAMKTSMRSMGMHIPPWRRNAYMQAKWFSCYKRGGEASPDRGNCSGSDHEDISLIRSSIGFEVRDGTSLRCRHETIPDFRFKDDGLFMSKCFYELI